VKYGFLEEVRGGYVCKTYSDKRITYKDLMQNDDVWNSFLDEFNEKSKKVLSYQNAISDQLEEIENEIDEDPE
jgi:hypothetical protein